MSDIDFNPLTGDFDLVGTGGGSSPPVTELDQDFTATETISAMKAVYQVDSTSIGLADATDAAKYRPIGIAITSGNLGDTITVRLFGLIQDSTLSAFSTNQRLFLSTAGSLSTSLPGSGYRVIVGLSLGGNRALIDIDEIVKL